MAAVYLEDILATSIVTVIAAYQLTRFALGVVAVRKKYKIDFPAVTGNEHFERVFRAQQNSLEWFPVYMITLWMSTLFFHQVPASLVGLVYIYSRHQYFKGYSRSVEERRPGFQLGAKCLRVMLAMTLAGFTTVLLRKYANIDLALMTQGILKNSLGITL